MSCEKSETDFCFYLSQVISSLHVFLISCRLMLQLAVRYLFFSASVFSILCFSAFKYNLIQNTFKIRSEVNVEIQVVECLSSLWIRYFKLISLVCFELYSCSSHLWLQREVFRKNTVSPANMKVLASAWISSSVSPCPSSSCVNRNYFHFLEFNLLYFIL